MVPLMASNVPVHITHTRPLPHHHDGDDDDDGGDDGDDDGEEEEVIHPSI